MRRCREGEKPLVILDSWGRGTVPDRGGNGAAMVPIRRWEGTVVLPYIFS